MEGYASDLASDDRPCQDGDRVGAAQMRRASARPLPSHTASYRLRFPSQRNDERHGEHHACEPDDEGHERLGREPPITEGDREPDTGRERRCAVAREPAPPDVLPSEGVELRCSHDGGRVLEQQVHFVGRLVDGHVYATHGGGQDIRLAQLLPLAGGERTVYGDGVAAPRHDLGGHVPLPDLELVRYRRYGAC